MDYQIQPGDTLTTIAAKHGTTVAALEAANPSLKANPNLIQAGAALSIPMNSAAPTSAPAAPVAPAPAGGSGTGAGTGSGSIAFQPVTLGNGQTVYVAPNGAFYDSGGNPVSNTTVQGATAASGAAGGSGTGAGGASGGITTGSTGDSTLDGILNSITGVANNLISTGYTIPADLQITPALVSDFLSYAHQAVDPYTQQQISGVLASVNSNLSNLANTYNNNMGQAIQDFGVGLASEQNTSGANGIAFSGARALGENNMVASTNRTLSSLASGANNDISQAAQTAAGQVGSANAGGINLPTVSTGSVSLSGSGGANLGSTVGSYNSNGALGFNYNPSIYTVGSVPSTGTAAANAQQASYLSQYGTLAGAQSNSGRSASDLIGMISGLPSGYTLPTNLT